MKDAYGGIINIVFIALFLVIVEGILGFVVSYTKAFKMKNIVISTFEEYQGIHCADSSVSGNSACLQKIKERANGIHYAPNPNLKCGTGTNVEGYFCLMKAETLSSKDGKKGSYSIYTISTGVDMNIPIVENIMGFKTFQVSGDTMAIENP